MSDFYGSYSISMDAKGRIALPTKVREELEAFCGGKIWVTASDVEKCLSIYPEPFWDSVAPKIRALKGQSQKVLRAKSLVLGFATEFEVPENGRVLLPQTHREYARMDKKLMLVGMGDKFWLWSEEHWNEFMNREDDGSDTPEELAELNY